MAFIFCWSTSHWCNNSLAAASLLSIFFDSSCVADKSRSILTNVYHVIVTYITCKLVSLYAATRVPFEPKWSDLLSPQRSIIFHSNSCYHIFYPWMVFFLENLRAGVCLRLTNQIAGAQTRLSKVAYSGKFTWVQILAEMPADAPEEIWWFLF